MGDDFESFCQQAQIILSGPPLDRQFLSGLWDGADKDLNRAINHLLGLPEDKVIREGQGGGSASPVESKPSKKESKPSKKTSKEAKKKEKKPDFKPSTDDWGGGFFDTGGSGFPDAGFQADFSSSGFPAGVQQQPEAGFSGMPAMTMPPMTQQANFNPVEMMQPPRMQANFNPAEMMQPPRMQANFPSAETMQPPRMQANFSSAEMMQQPQMQTNFASAGMMQPQRMQATTSTAWDSESDSENDWWNNPAPLAYQGKPQAAQGPGQYGSCFPTQMGGPGGGFYGAPPQFGSPAAVSGWG